MRVLALLLAVLYGLTIANPASALDKEALRRAVLLPQIQPSALASGLSVRQFREQAIDDLPKETENYQ